MYVYREGSSSYALCSQYEHIEYEDSLLPFPIEIYQFLNFNESEIFIFSLDKSYPMNKNEFTHLSEN